MKNIIVILATCTLLGCGKPSDGSNGQPGAPGQNGHNAVISILDDTTNCPNGGITILTATDLNDSGAVEIEFDSNISYREICNGVDGEDGKKEKDEENSKDWKEWFYLWKEWKQNKGGN